MNLELEKHSDISAPFISELTKRRVGALTDFDQLEIEGTTTSIRKVALLHNEALSKILLHNLSLTRDCFPLICSFLLESYEIALETLEAEQVLLTGLTEGNTGSLPLHIRKLRRLSGNLEQLVQTLIPTFMSPAEERVREALTGSPGEIVRNINRTKSQWSDFELSHHRFFSSLQVLSTLNQTETVDVGDEIVIFKSPGPSKVRLITETSDQPSGLSKVERVSIGDTVYHLRTPLRAEFRPMAKEFRVEFFSPVFVGQGADAIDARRNWEMLVHESFQRLSGLRPFEMSPKDAARWQVLQEHLDVARYFREQPLEFRRLGVVVKTHGGGERIIEWEDGSTSKLDLSQAPGSFAAFAEGQWFEAIMSWDVDRDEPIRMIYAQRIPPVCKTADFWQILQKTTDLPPVES